ncbi:hypothetical protein GE061_004654 [Apolygus lucorum]|uniref:Uncharacterized protein n=1 Tax=Apolygus lucorum TaxID=248454 RepID=A0A8S9X2F9_APOLU|nr:hypothetical protein GE061_004654 [Apolygus lucorum]
MTMRTVRGLLFSNYFREGKAQLVYGEGERWEKGDEKSEDVPKGGRFCSYGSDRPNESINEDESAFFLNPTRNKVLAAKGDKAVYQKVNNDKKECLTVPVTASASDHLAPAIVIFRYERMADAILHNFPEGWETVFPNINKNEIVGRTYRRTKSSIDFWLNDTRSFSAPLQVSYCPSFHWKMEDIFPKVCIKNTRAKKTEAGPAAGPVDKKSVTEDEQRRGLIMKKLSSLGLNLSEEQARKFARLKVRCQVAEGRMPPGKNYFAVKGYTKQVQREWYSRKMQRLNALYGLHQLLQLKMDVTEELKTCTQTTSSSAKSHFKKPIWEVKLMDFREHILNSIESKHRTLLFLSKFVNNQEFMREDRVISDLVKESGLPKWRPKLMQKKSGRPNKRSLALILEEIVKPLVAGSELGITLENPSEPQITELGEREEPRVEDVAEDKRVQEVHTKDNKPKTILSYLQNDRTAVQQSIMDTPVQTIDLHVASQVKSPTGNSTNLPLPGCLAKYYKRLSPFVDRNGSRKHLLTIVGQPISASLMESMKNRAVISVTPILMNKMKTQNGMTRRGRPRKNELMNDNARLELISKEFSRDSITNCTRLQSFTPTYGQTIRNNINQEKSITWSDDQLKQLCLTRKCFVKLERMIINQQDS